MSTELVCTKKIQVDNEMQTFRFYKVSIASRSTAKKFTEIKEWCTDNYGQPKTFGKWWWLTQGDIIMREDVYLHYCFVRD